MVAREVASWLLGKSAGFSIFQFSIFQSQASQVPQLKQLAEQLIRLAEHHAGLAEQPWTARETMVPHHGEPTKTTGGATMEPEMSGRALKPTGG